LSIRWGYAAAALVVFAVEVLIALFVRDSFVRPYLGDSLAVVLVYLALRARVVPAVLVALWVAFAVEFGQLLGVLDLLGLRSNQVARVLLGTDFAVEDFPAYSAGALAVLVGERFTGGESGVTA
jgi:hypothetical protein